MATGATYHFVHGAELSVNDFALMVSGVGRWDKATETVVLGELEKTEMTDYYVRRRAELEAELAAVDAWDDLTADREAAVAYAKALQSYGKRLEEVAVLRERTLRLLSQVEAWEPPASEVEYLKSRMRDQLEMVLKRDCGVYEWESPERQSGADYKAATLDGIRNSLSNNDERELDEIERIASVNRSHDALTLLATNPTSPASTA